MSSPQPPYGQQPPPGGPHQPGQPLPPQGGPYPPQGQPYPPQGQPPQGQPYPQQEQPYPPQGQQFPPQGQPYPQTPPPGQPPFPGAPDGATPPPPKSNAKLIRAIVVIVGILVVGGVGFYFFTKSPASANAGDCIKVNKASSTDADIEKIGCDSPDAVFKVGTKLDSDTASCPDGDYTQYTQSGRGSDFSLCLTVNAVKGDCLTGLNSPEKTRKVACGGSEVELEIVEVLDGKTDVEECASVEGAVNGLRYTEPPSVVCVKLP